MSEVELVSTRNQYCFRCSVCAREWPVTAPTLERARDRRVHERVVVHPGTLRAALGRKRSETSSR